MSSLNTDPAEKPHFKAFVARGYLQPPIDPYREEILGTDDKPYTVYTNTYDAGKQECEERFESCKTFQEAQDWYNGLLHNGPLHIAIYGRGGVIVQ